MTSTNADTPHGTSCTRTRVGALGWGRLGLVVATVSAWAAYQLGAFVRPAGPSDYVRQVEAAAARHQWTTPPALNVVELTRAATDLWPSDPAVERLRQRMAAKLAAEASRGGLADARRAQELARMARELDPESPDPILGGRLLPASPSPTLEPQEPLGGDDTWGLRD